MRMLYGFVDCQPGSAWNAFGIQCGDSVVAAREFREPFLDHVSQRFLIVAAPARILETRVSRQLRYPERAYKLRPLMRRGSNLNVLIPLEMKNAGSAAVRMQ